jgi:hypothetical protein
VIDIVRSDPAVRIGLGNVGGFSSVNQGFMFITLKPKDQRDKIQTIIGAPAAQPRRCRASPSSIRRCRTST